MKDCRKGFTLAELLIVVAIIAVLVAIAIPLFTSQLERSREAVDLANVRSAYAEVMSAAIVQDTSSPLYHGGTYQTYVPLKQKVQGWTMDRAKLTVGGISPADGDHWKRDPKPNGRCKVSYSDDGVTLIWCGEDHINLESAKDFLTKDILTQIVGTNYKYSVINSNETYAQGEGTKAFLDYAKEHGFDLADYGAATWQIYVKASGSGAMLEHPVIYWSTVDIKELDDGVFVPVMGYRDGKYDVYCAKVETYNPGTGNQYKSIHNGFANVTNENGGLGGTATFQFENYQDAKDAYDKILAVYQTNGTLNSNDMKENNLTD